MNKYARILVCGLAVTALPLMCQPTYAAETQAIYRTSDASVNASELSFEYNSASIYEIDCQVGYLTDIILRPGERVTHIAAGDTMQWMVDQAVIGNTTHVYIKPKVKDITTNLIINTGVRSYRLTITSGDTYTPIVSWTFAAEEKAEAEAIAKSRAAHQSLLNKTAESPDDLNFNYTFTRKRNIEEYKQPIAVFDDGVRTYIKMPKSNRYELPVLYNVGKDKKLMLINYRVKGNMYIADRCFTRARLIFGAKSSIDIIPKTEKDGDK